MWGESVRIIAEIKQSSPTKGTFTDNFSVEKLSKTLSQRYEKRNGGYCRVIRAGFRYGDDAPMAVIELVDRDIEAKKVDLKKKTDTPKKEATTSKKPEIEKKTKHDFVAYIENVSEYIGKDAK